MTIQYVHFKVNAEGVVEICRQAWLYEDKERWAIETIGYLAYGLPVDKILAVLKGEATLKNKGENECELVEERNEAWIKEIDEHHKLIEDKYLLIAGRKVSRDFVDRYADEIVSRLRNAIKNPGYLSIANPAMLMRLEDQRQEMHELIMKEAGFTDHDIYLFFHHGQCSEELTEFAYRLSIYVDNKTNWLNDN